MDSWMLDFALTRLPATPATGIVTFSRFADTLPATIPVGTIVKTTDGSTSFSVAANAALSIWQAASSSYVLPGGVGSADLPVICAIGGSIGNVLAGTITVIAASVPGIDQVSNANPLSDGADAETDEAFRARFQGYLASRSRATLLAVQNAIANVRQGLSVAIEENTAPDGTARIGSFLVLVDDGTGYPTADLLSTVAAAVDSVRPIGSTFAAIAPQVLIVNVSLTAILGPNTPAAVCIPVIQNCIAVYLNSLPIGGGASVTRIAQSIYLAVPGLQNVVGIQLNGSSSDVVPTLRTVIKSGQVTVTANGG
ncbi:MAG TPA: baseplate J/gp47 family protein [Rhodopila sp.]